MIRGDINLVWRYGYAFKKDLIEKIFSQWNFYTRTFLPLKQLLCILFNKLIYITLIMYPLKR